MEQLTTEWDALPTVSMAEELVVQFRRITTLEADWLRGLAAFDRRLGWQVMGYRSAASWLCHAVGVTMVTAREKLRVARVLTDGLHVVGNALAEGRISYCQARAICGLPEADEAVERSLVIAAEAGASVRDLDNLVVRRSGDVGGSSSHRRRWQGATTKRLPGRTREEEDTASGGEGRRDRRSNWATCH